MSGTVIILGANGRFGRAATKAFYDAGWHVRSFARSPQGENGKSQYSRIKQITGDAFNERELADAAKGCDVIVNALNPPYPQWSRDLPRLTKSVIYAAEKSGATVMIPGNVYNYGAGMPEILGEGTGHSPTTRKGRLRVEMEAQYNQADIQTIILRGGDYFEQQKTGDWFGSHITANLGKGYVMYPAPLDRLHAWAYLPDMARAMVGLAAKRQEFAAFEEFGFPGYGLTGKQLIAVLEENSNCKLKVKTMPWRFVRLLGVIIPQMREVAEMSYLWHTPHRIDGTKLTSTLPDFNETPLKAAFAQSVGI